MALALSSSQSYALTPPRSSVGKAFGGRKGGAVVFEALNSEPSKGSAFTQEESPREKKSSCVNTASQEETRQGDISGATTPEKLSGIFMTDIACHEGKAKRQNTGPKVFQFQKDAIHDNCTQEEYSALVNDPGSDSLEMVKSTGVTGDHLKLRRRPANLVVPAYSPAPLEFVEMGRKLENKEFEVEGRNFVLASKKGIRTAMEDRYGVMLDILGDPKQAIFAVIDGHGGHAAADYVAKNLGRNIVKALEDVNEGEDQLEKAIRSGYYVTDKGFLNQEISSGACTASVLLKDGELHVANVGDCRVVLSRNGFATALTNDHRPNREDERLRIENSGGFVNCRNGVWRVQGSLAVSRAIGDLHLKEWIISEPEIRKLRLTWDCEFLILASDGLWEMVNEQEAVDVVSGEKNLLTSCKKLVDMSCSRGNMDDITVMVIDLHNFMVPAGC